MTERSESERAELVALADKLQSSYDKRQLPTWGDIGDAASAVRRLAAPDQKPVAWRCRVTDIHGNPLPGWEYSDDAGSLGLREPLYLSPPPAAGWNEAIEACKKVAEKWLESFMGGEVYVARSIVNAIEAIRHNAPPDSGVGLPPIDESLHTPELIAELQKPAMQLDAPDHGRADAGPTSAFEVIADHFGLKKKAALSKPAPAAANASAEVRLREALEVSGDALDEYYRYWTGGESRGSYDGRPERDNLWKAMYAVRAARKSLSTHPHASDCDKQGER